MVIIGAYPTKMNWTGGTLQRTKKANQGTVQQQKAYFARARTQLQNASNPPVVAFRPNYLLNGDRLDITRRVPLLDTGHGCHPTKRQGERSPRAISPSNSRNEDPRDNRQRYVDPHLEVSSKFAVVVKRVVPGLYR